jgi:hypothetical protein
MPGNEFLRRYDEASGAGEIFELVKDTVRLALNRERAGLMLGLSDLGIAQAGFVGGFHQMGSNAIILNSSVLKRISRARPEILKPYSLSVLLHEYLHALGVLDETRARLLTYKICSESFGEDHEATRMSRDFNRVGKELLAKGGPEKPGNYEVSFVDRFDSGETGYIG